VVNVHEPMLAKEFPSLLQRTHSVQLPEIGETNMRLNACIILLCVSSAFALGQPGQTATGLSDTLATSPTPTSISEDMADNSFGAWSTGYISTNNNPVSMAPKDHFTNFGDLSTTLTSLPSEKSQALQLKKYLYVIHLIDWSEKATCNGLPEECPNYYISGESSQWYVYQYTGKLFEVILPTDGALPPIYNKAYCVLLSVSRIRTNHDTPAPLIQYSVNTPEHAASNVTALRALVNGVLGLTSKEVLRFGAPHVEPAYKYNYSVQSFAVSAKPLNAPFDVTFTATAKPANAKAGQDANSASSAQGANTTDKGQDTQGSGIASAASNVAYCRPLSDDGKCKFSRTFTVESRQYWNVGVNIVARGPRENKYALSSSEVVTQTHTLHAPIIAALDVSPWAYKLPMDKYPYIQVGVPLSGAAFHMPYFGLAQPLPYIKKWLPISAYGGVVLMKQTFPKTIRVGQTTTTAAFNSDLTTDWPVKAAYGIEVPVSSIINKVKSSVGSGK
jgi:hypothetical protein